MNESIARLDRMDAKLDRIELAIVGGITDTGETTVGIAGNVRRNTRDINLLKNQRKWWARAITAATISAVGASLWSLITNGKAHP